MGWFSKDTPVQMTIDQTAINNCVALAHATKSGSDETWWRAKKALSQDIQHPEIHFTYVKAMCLQRYYDESDHARSNPDNLRSVGHLASIDNQIIYQLNKLTDQYEEILLGREAGSNAVTQDL